MTSRNVAKILYELETLLELNSENDFKSKAYGRAARALENTMVDIEAAVRSGAPIKVSGIGPALASEVVEIVETGTSRQLEDLRETTPGGLLDMLKIRGLGAKKVRAIHLALGIASLEELEKAARENLIAPLAGFGAKSQEKILAGVVELFKNQEKLRIREAVEIGERLLAMLEGLTAVKRASMAGRLRRGAEEFDSLSFVVEPTSVEALVGDLGEAAVLEEIERDGDRVTARTADGIRVLIDAAAPGHYHTLLHNRTGPSDYRFMVSIPLADRGFELRADGLYRDGEPVAIESEEELFAHGGMQFIEPEIREGVDEVRRALDGTIPELVRREHLRGMLHVHSTWSDGRSPIADIAEHVRGLGYAYLLMTDHSKSAFYANGLDERRLEAQGREIDEINQRYDPAEFRVLRGTECDILADGSLDFSDDVLASLDAVVASVHSQFNLPMEAQTERVCRALENPYVTILGHSTGRLILKRKGYDIDLKQVIETAAGHGKSIELNCNPMRLDLNWRMVRHARRKGVPIAINPDAHQIADFANMRHGITMARKGWLTPDGTLNALTADELISFSKKSVVDSR
jgi:DNA polymerase (family 10)